MSQIEDYQTSLTEEQKKILDDAPPKVIEHLIEYCKEYGQIEFFNLRVTDKLTGVSTYAAFRGVSAVNAMDYIRFLIRNGYKEIADAG